MYFSKILFSGMAIAAVQARGFPMFGDMLDRRGGPPPPKPTPTRTLPRTPCTYVDTAPGGEEGCQKFVRTRNRPTKTHTKAYAACVYLTEHDFILAAKHSVDRDFGYDIGRDPRVLVGIPSIRQLLGPRGDSDTMMRLLNIKTFKLETFFGDTPPYAILSHTWGPEEVPFRTSTATAWKRSRGG
ncbi:hypothetical protein ACJZ2D_000403 [Fusarium nematophilum]